MCGNLGGHEAIEHILGVGQAQVLGRCHVAQEVGARARGDGATDGGGDVVVAHADIGHQRPQHIERGVVAQALLQFHVGSDLVERHVARSLDHNLDAGGPGALA